MVASTGGLTLTATMRVIDRVHGDSTPRWAFALPAHAAGLAPVDVALLGVAHLTDRCAAAQVDVADLTGRHTQLRVGTVLGHKLHLGAGRPCDLGAAAGAKLDRMDHRTHGDVAHRQAVARLDVGARAALDLVTLAELVRRQDIALLAIGIVQQGDTGGAVGVVLDVSDLCLHAVLVMATEVDQSIGALVSATDVTRRDAPGVVAATALGERTAQRLLRRRPRDLHEVGDTRPTTTWCRRLVLADSHCLKSSVPVVSMSPRQPGHPTEPPKMSIEPSLRVTIARLVFLRLPKPNLVRLVLPWRLRLLTESTLTPKTRSTAILISVLLARGSTTKVYLPSSSRPYDFSDTTGASRMSRGSLFNVLTWRPPCHPQPVRA